MDPLNPKNNVGGKKTEVLKMQGMFRTIYYSMHQVNLTVEETGLLPYLMQMNQLFWADCFHDFSIILLPASLNIDFQVFTQN